MRREEQVLAECCRVNPDASRLRLYLKGPIDWVLLAELGKWHGLRPLLAKRLGQLAAGSVPQAVLNQFHDDGRAVACRNLLLVAELGDILRLFSAQRIQAFSLKGPALAAAAYGGVEGREFEDLDVFIRREAFVRAQSVLARLGYKADLDLRGSEDHYCRSNHQMAFTKAELNARVEIHWGLQEHKFLGVDLKPDEWWGRLELNTISGYSSYSLAPADLILFLCLHGGKHVWERWKWICDIAGLAGRFSEAEWAHVLHNADRLGALPILLLGLELAFQFTGVRLPEVVRQAIDNEHGLTQKASLLRRRVESTAEPSTFSMAFAHLRMHSGFSAGLQYFRNHLFTPTAGDWKGLHLARRLLFLYPVLRPLRLVTERLLESARRMLGLRT